MLRKAALFLLSLIVMLNLFQHLKTTAFAQSSVQQSNPQLNTSPYGVPDNNPDVPKNLHTYTQNVMVEVLSSTICQLAGIDPVNPTQKCLGVDSKTNKIGFVENGGGLVGVMGNMITMLYQLPIHGGDYVRYIAGNFGISQKTYAASASYFPETCRNSDQGLGFCGLSPLLPIWAKFRDISYLAFVLVFVLVGVGIMLRIKIDPRTVMSIQNQIPKLIISILLVTFSFAIAGFLVDMMYASMSFAYGLVSSPQLLQDPNGLTPGAVQGKPPLEAAQGITGGSVFGVANDMSKSTSKIIKGLLGVDCISTLECASDHFNPLNFVFDPSKTNPINILFNLISSTTGTFAYFKISGLSGDESIAGTKLPSIVQGFPAGIIAGTAAYGATQTLLRDFLPWLIGFLVFLIALVWALFRTWFALLKAYIFILVAVVFSPFWMLSGAVPGEGRGIGPWLRDILSNLSAFVTVYVLFLMGSVFEKALSSSGGSLFTPPFLGNPNASGTIIGSLISFGLILLAPQAVNMMHDFFKAPDFKFVAAIGQAVGVGTGVLTSPVTSVAGTASWLGQQKMLQSGPLSKFFGSGGGGHAPPR